MIKRTYFMHVRKNHGDGKGSYSFAHAVATFSGWRNDPQDVYRQMLDHIMDDMKEKPGDNYEVCSFSRL